MQEMIQKIGLEELQTPFELGEIAWKIQKQGITNGKIWALVVPYIKTDAIENRLDQIVGAENWKNEPFQPGANGGLQCGISIRIHDEWVTKWDGAENTDYEAVKGGMSDAFKRAARRWGIGRYLVRVGAQLAQVLEQGGRYRGYLKDQKLAYTWNPPLLPDFCLPSPRTQQSPTPTNQPAPATEPTETTAEAERLKTEISNTIQRLKEEGAQLSNGRKAWLHFTKAFFACNGDLQKLIALAGEIYHFQSKGDLKKAA